ncbi:MAG: carboxypeptidase regulatory-like domain-containing protein, partial [Planctomycetes bacterium]|nr:carboxypeptidase regulatory-like domain-containing protein [Planctomycetota bacterium]
GGGGGGGGGVPTAPGQNDPPPASDTRIYGTVLDASDDSPLQGVKITILNVVGTAMTDSQGRFMFPVPGQGTYALTANLDGYTYGQRVVTLAKGQLVTVADIYLTPLDFKVITLGPGGGTGGNSDGSMQIDAPPGALATETKMRATRFKRGKELPNFLPDLSHFTYACELTPDGLSFDAPVTVRMKNERGFSPGTRIPVGVYSPDALQWSHESMGEVSKDGNWVVFQVNHFSPRDINLSMISPAGSDEPGSAKDVSWSIGSKMTRKNNQSCGSLGGGSRIGIADGHLSVDHILPTYQSLGTARTVALQYNSQNAAPSVLLGVSYDFSQVTALMPERIRMVVSVGGKRIERFFKPVNGPMRFQYCWNGEDGLGLPLASGIYDYEIELANQYPAEFALTNGFGQAPAGSTGIQANEYVDFPGTFTGRVRLNRDISAFGAGWDLTGLFRLEWLEDTVTIAGGDGAFYTFAKNSDDVYEPALGDFSSFSAGAMADTYEWTHPDLRTITFDVQGRQISETDRNGNTTSFTCDTAGRLTKISDPLGKGTHFAYNALGKIDSITDPYGRITLFDVDAGGNLVSITNPDGSM